MINVTMQQSRRKKKRVNHGVRMVEVVRGSKGYGFTISGQQPCILSCIVQGSPAEDAGLRAGDYLVAVNGQNVSKLLHDDVVKLIGHSRGILRLQIAENYYSDSSDDEGLTTVRSKPKYMHKPRAANSTGLQLQCGFAKVVRDLHSNVMLDTEVSISHSKSQCSLSGLHHRWNMSSPLPPPPPPVLYKRESEKIVHRTIVGYLGTIDIPNQLHPSSMMQVLRKCIKRLKAEKRNPTTVLLTIHVANIKLTNSESLVIAEYPSHRIIFCNSISEQDKQYFGILTKSVRDSDDIVSNSCHVFSIYYKMIDHAVHSNTCNIFGFTCTKTSEHNVCQEFPDSCNSLIGAIQTLYISNSNEGESSNYSEGRRHQEASSPQPSNVSTSTAHSSNSDSGIGFKDDCYGNYNGRKLALTNRLRQRQRFANEQDKHKIPVNSKLNVRVTNNCKWNDVGRKVGKPVDLEKENLRCSGDTATCPGTSAAAAAAISLTQGLASTTSSTSVASLASVCSTELLRRYQNSYEMLYESTVAQSDNTNNFSMCNKLSPKVYCATSRSLVHSLDDLSPSAENSASLSRSYSDKADIPRPWGSMQEMRNVHGEFDSANCLYASTESCNQNTEGKSVHSWANGFEKLLADPKGLQTFAEFLKKEFSHENIYFWAACERYKDTEDLTSRQKLAFQIYQRHLSNTAAEPVNVDSHASGQITQELLSSAPVDLFLQAQKQVFNLMKFDSYPRFLRSDLYRRCLETGNSIVNVEDCDLNLTTAAGIKLKKSHSDAEDRCRKSILPWHRKNRSKSKDRGESEYNKTPSRSETIYKSFTTIKREVEGNNNHEDTASISSSRSSLASWDLALRQSFNKHLINLKYPSSVLAGQEVEVVPSKILKVDIPLRRTVTVVAHKGRTLKEVLRPLLNKYGYNLESISIWGEGQRLSVSIQAITAPARLTISSNIEDSKKEASTQKFDEVVQNHPTLDEITNKVFEELLVGKSTKKYQYDEGSCKSDDQRSESSSILPSKFFLRDSTLHGKRKGKSKINTNEKAGSIDSRTEETRSHPPLIAKWRNGVKLQLPGRFDGDDLYEGLKRAQRSRLEDQRGTEINFELPDFLKNKENGKIVDNKIRKATKSVELQGTTKFYDTLEERKLHKYGCLVNGSISSDRLISDKSADSPSSLDGTLLDADQTIIDNHPVLQTTRESSPSPRVQSSLQKSPKPPPLPPKPKGLITNAIQTYNTMSSKSAETSVFQAANDPS
ncbi:regulator of G-protein signaling loco isoform X2 [Prorops nasuta]|uniref:regulator of G-protein signaling loco isoform X2 n=1 Tax=Prorops nasuta TaxID=863751 RepID=UPI0034CF403D